MEIGVVDALLDNTFFLLCQSLLDKAEGNDVQVHDVARLRRVRSEAKTVCYSRFIEICVKGTRFAVGVLLDLRRLNPSLLGNGGFNRLNIESRK